MSSTTDTSAAAVAPDAAPLATTAEPAFVPAAEAASAAEPAVAPASEASVHHVCQCMQSHSLLSE